MAAKLSPGTKIIQSGAPAVYPREVQVRARYQVPDLLRRGSQPGQRVKNYRLIAGPRQHSQFLHHSLIAATESAPVQMDAVSYTHLRAHETVLDLVCRLLLEKKNINRKNQ